MGPLGSLLKVSAFRLALWIGALTGVLHFLANYAGARFELPIVARLDHLLYDAKFALRGPIGPSDADKAAKKVVIVAGDEATIREHGRFPWDRTLYAKLIENVVTDGAAVIAFDVSFADEDRSGRLPGLAELKQRAAEVQLAALSPEAAEINTRLANLAAKSSDDVLAEAIAKHKDRVVVGYIHYPVDSAEKPPVEKIEAGFELLSKNPLAPVKTGLTVLEGGAVKHDAAAEVKGSGLWPDVLPDPPVPAIAAAAERFGYFNVDPDFDGTIRRVPLVALAGGVLVPSIELAAVAATLGVDHDWITPVSDDVDRPWLSAVFIDGVNKTIPVLQDGSMYVDFHGEDGAFQQISIADAAAGRFPEGTFRDRVALVGVTAIGTHDHRVTPFDKFTPGVETHAAAIENILQGRVLQRTYWAAPVELVLLALVSALLGLLFSKVDARVALIAYVLAAVGYFALDYLAFTSGFVLVSALPQLQLLGTFVATTSYRYLTETREKQKVRRAFQYYLDTSVMEEMLKAPEKLKLGGDKVELSVMFSDIRGFTTLSEKLQPEELVAMLNEYLTPMTGLVFKNGGTLDKYMGDAIMCFFGAPVPQKDHALRACRTALEMLEKLGELKAKWDAEGKPGIDIGIGINSGPMVVGNMGSDMRFDYTVMGDHVNLGSRLEGTNKEYGTRIILSEFTYEQVKGLVAVRELGAVRVKGKKLPVKIYELLAMGEVPAADKPFVAAFEAGLRARHPSRDFSAAAAHFREALRLRPGDPTSARYLAECEVLSQHPPDATWDGVYEMKTK